MGSVIQCFFLEPSDAVEESLRRFVFYRGENPITCVGGKGYHDAEVVIGAQPWTPDVVSADDFDHADPRWPKTCACGYEFQPDDAWQHNMTRLYARTDTGERMTLSAAPPGAMWYADWFPDELKRAPDGRVLIVKTPCGDWNVDAKSTNGDGWTRTGTPPNVTANPSILIGKKPDGSWGYHGWLTNGKLIEC